MRKVFLEVCAWEQALGALDLRVSLNVSARQFGPELSRKVGQILAETGVNRSTRFEITESAILRDEAGVIQTLRELRWMGSRSRSTTSVRLLLALLSAPPPVDTLKIDQSFVKSIAHSTEGAALTRSIVAMARRSGCASWPRRRERDAARAAHRVELRRDPGLPDLPRRAARAGARAAARGTARRTATSHRGRASRTSTSALSPARSSISRVHTGSRSLQTCSR